MTFEEICQAARDNDQAKLTQWKQQYGTLDITTNASCTFGSEETGGTYEVQVRFTPASYLAWEGNQTASELMGNLSETAIGFILSGKIEMAEQYRARGASVDQIAWALALIKQHDLVKSYIRQYKAKLNAIVSGYEMSNCTTEVAHYSSLRFQSMQPTGNPKPPLSFDDVYSTALAAVNDEIANHKLVQWQEQRLDIGARKLVPIKIVKADGVTECELYFRLTADTLLAAQGHSQASLSLAKIYGEGTGCAIGFALKGEHDKVESCRKRFRMSFNLIAKAYAMAGYHDKVEYYRDRYNAKLDDIIAGYQIGDDFEKQLHYLELAQTLKKRKFEITEADDSATSAREFQPMVRRKTESSTWTPEGLFKPIKFDEVDQRKNTMPHLEIGTKQTDFSSGKH